MLAEAESDWLAEADPATAESLVDADDEPPVDVEWLVDSDPADSLVVVDVEPESGAADSLVDSGAVD